MVLLPLFIKCLVLDWILHQVSSFLWCLGLGVLGWFFFKSCMGNYSMCYLLLIRTATIIAKSIVINLVQVSKELPQGSSVGKLNFHVVNPDLHSSLYATSVTQQGMFGVMCLDKKIDFAQRYLKIHCKSTLVQLRIESGSSLRGVNVKI